MNSIAPAVAAELVVVIVIFMGAVVIDQSAAIWAAISIWTGAW